MFFACFYNGEQLLLLSDCFPGLHGPSENESTRKEKILLGEQTQLKSEAKMNMEESLPWSMYMYIYLA